MCGTSKERIPICHLIISEYERRLQTALLECLYQFDARDRTPDSAVQSASGAFMIAPLTPLDFLARSASVFRDCVAVIDGERSFTYNDFQVRVHRLAAALQAVGVAPGDRVA